MIPVDPNDPKEPLTNPIDPLPDAIDDTARASGRDRTAQAKESAAVSTDSALGAQKAKDAAARVANTAANADLLVTEARRAKTTYMEAAAKAKNSATAAAASAEIAAADARDAALKSEVAHEAAAAAGLVFGAVDVIVTPSLRQHVWERPARADERLAGSASGYDVELPRWLHRYKANGEAEDLRVNDPAAYEKAIAEGWCVHLDKPFEAPDVDSDADPEAEEPEVPDGEAEEPGADAPNAPAKRRGRSGRHSKK